MGGQGLGAVSEGSVGGQCVRAVCEGSGGQQGAAGQPRGTWS